MDVFEFLKFAPKIALFILPLAIAFLSWVVFKFFKSQKKKEEQPRLAVSPLAPAESSTHSSSSSTPPPASAHQRPLLLILTTLFFLLSLPLAILLVKQKQEKQDIRMKAAENQEPTPTIPTLTPQCSRIKIYDQNWEEIAYENLSQLLPEQTIRISVRGEGEKDFDKGRIRINNIGWVPENETIDQKPDSPGEFYIECQVEIMGEKAIICGISADLENEFKIEGEVHDAVTNEWR